MFALISQDAEQGTDEMMWGAPGAAFAASFMWEWTHEQRWRDAFLRKIKELWLRWEFRAEQNCFLWMQRLYQPEAQVFLGSVHGFSGNACVMMRAASLIDERMREEMYDRIAGGNKSDRPCRRRYGQLVAPGRSTAARIEAIRLDGAVVPRSAGRPWLDLLVSERPR